MIELKSVFLSSFAPLYFNDPPVSLLPETKIEGGTSESLDLVSQ